eukprot:SAG22_NODE_4357_length_1293_cov_1.242044_2_plen_93_part_00
MRSCTTHKVGLLSTGGDGTEREARSGAELWAFLRPRLGVLTKLQRQWGGVHDMYGGFAESLFDSQKIPHGVYDPDSSFSSVWELLQGSGVQL